MNLLDRLFGDPEAALKPSGVVVPDVDLDTDDPGTDEGDADGQERAAG